MPRNRMVKYFRVLLNILIQEGFMPRNRRVKYFHKCIVEYIGTLRASCPATRGLSTSIRVL
jgi:hypothetical protein